MKFWATRYVFFVYVPKIYDIYCKGKKYELLEISYNFNDNNLLKLQNVVSTLKKIIRPIKTLQLIENGGCFHGTVVNVHHHEMTAINNEQHAVQINEEKKKVIRNLRHFYDNNSPSFYFRSSLSICLLFIHISQSFPGYS